MQRRAVMVWVHHAGPAEKSDGHTYTHAHTDGYTLTRTTRISHWLRWPVSIAEMWGFAVNWSRWKEEKPKRAVEGAVVGNPARASWRLFANDVGPRFGPVSQPGGLG